MGYETGKCAWEKVEDARRWKGMNADPRFYKPPVRILMLELPADATVTGVFTDLGSRLDGVGPAWVVPVEVFSLIKGVSEVPG